jgi:hypothetical protein
LWDDNSVLSIADILKSDGAKNAWMKMPYDNDLIVVFDGILTAKIIKKFFPIQLLLQNPKVLVGYDAEVV